MIKFIVITFLLDFGLRLDYPVKIVLVPADSILRMVDDPYRGMRKIDGRCDPTTKTVIINRDHWDQINAWQKKELLYHELGHCILQLYHTRGMSIMNPFSSTIYHVKPDGSNWSRLVSKMKSRKKLFPPR